METQVHSDITDIYGKADPERYYWCVWMHMENSSKDAREIGAAGRTRTKKLAESKIAEARVRVRAAWEVLTAKDEQEGQQ